MNQTSVNMAKTKIVPFGSNPRFLRESWTMNDHIVEVTDSYKYLGTWLHWKSKFKIAMSYQSDAASKAMFTLLNKLRELKITDVQIALKLFNSMVKPILLYNSEIWGVQVGESSAIERQCLKFYKYILAVAQSSVNAAIYWELGLFPIGRDCKLRAIEYLLYLMSHQSSQLLSDALQLSISLAEKELNSWFYQIIAYISTLGLQCSYNCIPPIQEITYRINDIFTQDLLYRIDNQAGVTTSGGNKLRFYSTITHQVHQMADYLLTIENFSTRTLFTRFRISNHNLMIEKGRHHSPPLAIKDRVCPLCHTGEVEDEVHFLLVCPLYDSLREQFLPEVSSQSHGEWRVAVRNLFRDQGSLPVAKFIQTAMATRERLLSSRL